MWQTDVRQTSDKNHHLMPHNFGGAKVTTSWLKCTVVLHAYEDTRKPLTQNGCENSYADPRANGPLSLRQLQSSLEMEAAMNSALVYLRLFSTVYTDIDIPFPFSALTVLFGRQEGHPVCKTLGVGLLVTIIWLELCTTYSSSCYPSTHHFCHS